MGESLGLTGAELLEFMKEQQALERAERQAGREAKEKEREEREKDREHMLQHTPATALNRLAHMISGRAVEEAVTTNLFAWVSWIVTKEENFSVDCRADWKIDSPMYYNVY